MDPTPADLAGYAPYVIPVLLMTQITKVLTKAEGILSVFFAVCWAVIFGFLDYILPPDMMKRVYDAFGVALMAGGGYSALMQGRQTTDVTRISTEQAIVIDETPPAAERYNITPPKGEDRTPQPPFRDEHLHSERS